VTPFTVGAAIRAYGGTKENRPGVVLRIWEVDDELYLFVAFGTAQPPPMAVTPVPVFIDSSHAAFASLGLDLPTWFKPIGGGRLRATDPSIRIVGTCPPDVLVAVRRLYGFR
jgi:hypothetical protein